MRNEEWTVLGMDAGVSTGLAMRRRGKRRVHTRTQRFPRDYSQTKDVRLCLKALHELDEWLQEFWFTERLLVSAELFRVYDGSVSAKPEAFSAMWVHAQVGPFLMEKYGEAVAFKRFTSGTAKSSVTNDRLRASGLWVPGNDNRHIRDAMRCMVLGERYL